MIFKKLKLNFVIIYTLSIFAIVTVSFLLIFYNSYKNTREEIERNLEFKDKDINIQETLSQKENITLGEISNYHILSENMIIIKNAQGELIPFSGQIFTNDEMLTIKTELNNDSSNMFYLDDRVYVYRQYGPVFNVINITNDVKGLVNLLENLVIYEILILILSIIIGYLFAKSALKPVKESFDKQTIFISDASHELRTPLSVVLSCMELVKEKDDESEKWIDYSISEAMRLKLLTTTMLSLTENKSNINFKAIESIDASKELDLILCAYETRLFEENYDFQSSVQEGLRVKILEDEFKQFIHILIDNAIKYNNENKKISISFRKEGRSAVLRISNTADYISKKEIKSFFDRFYRNEVSRNKKVEGFGLGLAIIKDIMGRYNIKSDVRYNLGEINFTFKFNIG